MNRNRIAAIVLTTALPLGLGAGRLWADVTTYDGPARFQGTTVTVANHAGVGQLEMNMTVKAWSKDTPVHLVEVQGPADITLVNDDQCSTLRNCGGEARRTFTDGYITGCEIAVQDPTDVPILTHEVGHCLGLTHLHKGTSNMHWFAGDFDGGWSEVVTAEDRARLVNLYR